MLTWRGHSLYAESNDIYNVSRFLRILTAYKTNLAECCEAKVLGTESHFKNLSYETNLIRTVSHLPTRAIVYHICADFYFLLRLLYDYSCCSYIEQRDSLKHF